MLCVYETFEGRSLEEYLTRHAVTSGLHLLSTAAKVVHRITYFYYYDSI